MLYDSQAKIINKNTKIYSACRYKIKFYVFEHAIPIPGTNEGDSRKRSRMKLYTKSQTVNKIYIIFYMLDLLYCIFESKEGRSLSLS